MDFDWLFLFVCLFNCWLPIPQFSLLMISNTSWSSRLSTACSVVCVSEANIDSTRKPIVSRWQLSLSAVKRCKHCLSLSKCHIEAEKKQAGAIKKIHQKHRRPPPGTLMATKDETGRAFASLPLPNNRRSRVSRHFKRNRPEKLLSPLNGPETGSSNKRWHRNSASRETWRQLAGRKILVKLPFTEPQKWNDENVLARYIGDPPVASRQSSSCDQTEHRFTSAEKHRRRNADDGKCEAKLTHRSF